MFSSPRGIPLRHGFRFRSQCAPMNPSPPTLSPEDQEQILQTIEMFEVIVQANPQDCQSMEILKDAYSRLGMQKEMVSITKRLAQTLIELGQYSTAMLEYELILQTRRTTLELDQVSKPSTKTAWPEISIRCDFGRSES